MRAIPARVGVAAQRLPVAREAPLDEANEVDLLARLLAEPRQSGSVAVAQRRRPACPLDLPVDGLDRAVEREVVQPVARLFGEPPKVRIVGPPALREGDERIRQVTTADVAAIVRPQDAVGDQTFEADQRRIPRERRLGAVWRITVPGRADREHLPPALSGGSQEIDHLARRCPQVLAGKAGRVQEHATGPIDELWQAQRRLKLNVADRARRDFRLL